MAKSFYSLHAVLFIAKSQTGRKAKLEVFKLPRTKGINRTLAAYQRGQGVAAANYKEGVQGSTGWQQAAINGEALYAAKVQEAVANQSRAKALANVSESEWKNRAVNVGSQRIASGMKAAEDKYQKKMAVNLQAIENTQLPARSANFEENYERSKAIGRALRAANNKA